MTDSTARSFTFTTPAPGERPPGVSDFAANAAAAAAANPELREIRDRMLAKATGNVAPDDDAEVVQREPKPREDVESVEVQLPDGRVVLFGPPPMVSLTIKIAELLGEKASNPVLSASARIMLCVRAIDGKAVPPINSVVEVKKWAGVVGDAGLDTLGMVYAQYWSPPTIEDLPVLKKNLRGA